MRGNQGGPERKRRFRLRGKRAAQEAQPKFRLAPGSGLLPPGVPRLPFQTPPSKRRQDSPAGATPDEAPQATGVRQVPEAEQPNPATGVRQVEQTPRAKWGTQLTFAGRRLPNNPKKRQLFDDLRMEYYRQKEQYRKTSRRTGRIYSENKYHKFMKLEMQATMTITTIIKQIIISTIMMITITRICPALASQALNS